MEEKVSFIAEAQRVYKPSPPERYEWIIPDDTTAFRSSLRGGIIPMSDDWESLQVHFLRKDGRSRFDKYSDLPWLSGSYMVLRPGLANRMQEILSQWGEFLPLQCEEEDLVLFHATVALDILDEETSKVKRSSVTNAIILIDEFRAKPENLPERGIFKVTGWEHGPLHLTESMVQAFQKAGCRGAQFDALWGSDAGSYFNRSRQGSSPVSVTM